MNVAIIGVGRLGEQLCRRLSPRHNVTGTVRRHTHLLQLTKKYNEIEFSLDPLPVINNSDVVILSVQSGNIIESCKNFQGSVMVPMISTAPIIPLWALKQLNPNCGTIIRCGANIGNIDSNIVWAQYESSDDYDNGAEINTVNGIRSESAELLSELFHTDKLIEITGNRKDQVIDQLLMKSIYGSALISWMMKHISEYQPIDDLELPPQVKNIFANSMTIRDIKNLAVTADEFSPYMIKDIETQAGKPFLHSILDAAVTISNIRREMLLGSEISDL